MKLKKLSKLLASSLLITTCFATLIGCGSNAKSEEPKNDNPKAEESKSEETSTKPEDLTGTVTYCVYPHSVETAKEQIKAFNEIYPNVEIVIQEVTENNADIHLSAMAASGTLPDIVNGRTVVYPLSQGWLYPIDEFLANDPDFKDVPDALMKEFKIDGKTYALPFGFATEGLIVNIDLLDKLNIDIPDYDWTVDEFKEICKKATTSKYSAIDHVNGFAKLYTGIFDENLSQWGYNADTGKFDLSSGAFSKAVALEKDLMSIPGLVAESLVNTEVRDAGKEDDYMKKFGKNSSPFMDGNILMAFVGSWDLDWMRPDFNYDFYPLPIDPEVGYRQVMHVDDLHMLASVKEENKQAAYEFMKFGTYGTNGVLSSFEYRATLENPSPYIYFPPVKSQEVSDYFNNLDYPGGIKYMYNNQDKSFRGDNQKVIPGFSEVMAEVIPDWKKVMDGSIDITSITAELEEKANKLIDEKWNTLREDMSKFDYYK